MTPRRSLARTLRAVGLLAALGFGGYALVSQWSKIGSALDRVGIATPLLSWLAAMAGLAVGALAWRALLADLGVPMGLRTTARVFFIGQLGKYLPGGLWPVLAQMELGHDEGAGRRQVGTAAVLLMAVNVVTGLLIAVLCLPLTSSHALHRVGWLLVFLPVGVAALHPRVLGAVIGRALRLLRREPLDRLPTGRGLLVASGWMVITWAFYGLHLYLLARPLAASGHRLPLLVTGGFALAWSVGFLVVIAPAGAGAREAVLVASLAPAMPAAAATTVAVLSRLAMTMADFALAGLAGLGARRRSRAVSSRA